MKSFLHGCLMVGVFMMMMSGGAVPLLNIDATEAYAMGSRHSIWQHKNNGENNGGGSNGGGYQVPEPATLSLVGLGVAGVGIFYALKGRRRK